jgi:metallo-beta-lactamase family protein
MYQGFPGAEERNRRKFEFDPKRISAVLLTHAHVDHCGLLPRLVREGFRGKIICTRATAEFTKIALQDPVGGESDLWDARSVAMLDNMFSCPDDKPEFTFGHTIPLDQDLFCMFLRSAHVVGSVAIEVRVNVSTTKNMTFTFSGDIGPCADGALYGGMQKRRQYPNPTMSTLLCESTYGGKKRRPESATFAARTSALASVLSRALSTGPDPIVIFPSFSLQRMQDLLVDIDYVFRNHEMKWPEGQPVAIYVDSEQARRHSEVMFKELQRRDGKGRRRWLNAESPLFEGLSDHEIDERLQPLFLPKSGAPPIQADGRTWSVSYGPPKRSNGPRIVFAGPGTCMGGRALKHLGEQVRNAQATIVFSGYVPMNSPGHKLRLLRSGTEAASTVNVLRFGELECLPDEVKAVVENLGEFYSGHTDEDGLIDFMLTNDTAKQVPELSIILNHGDRVGREAMKRRIEQATTETHAGLVRRSVKAVHLPDWNSGWFDLEAGEWEKVSELPMNVEDRLSRIERAVAELLATQESIIRRLDGIEL